MNQEYIKPDAWSIIEEGWDPERVKSSESLFALGNGAMGQRANFEESYSGETFQGSYIAGVYYPDKTRVGWWKNGYPEYFAKVLNAPNWIGIDVFIDGEAIDLHNCKVSDYKRELNMRKGWHERTFQLTMDSGKQVHVCAKRFLSLRRDELGAIQYSVTAVNGDMQVEFQPYIDAGITNEDSNWDDAFWSILGMRNEDHRGMIFSKTNKTDYGVCTFMQSSLSKNGEHLCYSEKFNQDDKLIRHRASIELEKGVTATLTKYGGYVSTLNHPVKELYDVADAVLNEATQMGYEQLLEEHCSEWKNIWEMADITIEGDLKAQQGIRFNIFQLNQTYLGRDARLNIGPKGFTGEKYGGSTYWDTEAYCLPFYMSTKGRDVARNLLKYRYKHLEKAKENAQKLGFVNGAALYPMVTMNGEESHNEWEITFEEIHRNGAMIYAIRDYVDYTGDYSYIPEMGMEVMIAVARFWKQRVNFSEAKQKYVMLGVTGPNEYENNVNNNWYTNYLAKWCLEYTMEHWEILREHYEEDYQRLKSLTQLNDSEILKWKEIADKMYLPYDADREVFLQQDGFLDKELKPVDELPSSARPINQHWSWDRILRSCFIKQADVLQGFYLFENNFDEEEMARHYDFYEPMTVHESSLSPCVHSILAAHLGRMEKAYELYLRTSRLDLDDYNHEVEEGCHITSMAGTWMSIVEGFGGMKVVDNTLTFNTQRPQEWDSFSFKINFRGSIIKVTVNGESTQAELVKGEPITVKINNREAELS